MELIGAKIQGFRRFEDSTSVRLLEDLIALVGQNESGKTSFLEALEELNTESEIEDEDQTRRVDTDTKISATFSLEESDYEDLEHIEQGEVIEKCTFTKQENGGISVSLDPAPNHQLSPRRDARTQLESFLDSDVADEKIGNRVISDLKKVPGYLDSDDDFLGDETLNQIQETVLNLENGLENLESRDEDTGSTKPVLDSLQHLVEHERNSPPELARETLLNKRPRFLFFGESDRDLKSTYDLSKALPNPPDSLANLAELAELDLNDLKSAAEAGKVHVARDLTQTASEKLEEDFSKSWVRSDVVPVLDIDGTILHIHVRTPDERNRAPMHQRSDGLRWFVALLAFLNQKEAGEDPVLLVDEAETHLSYDAQAELVEVLETQTIAQKVIYTTHSAGCLPSDLGRGIRPVIQNEGERSDIRNGFWVDEPGFKPIMLAMGLNPLAFTVTRNSLIAEGPCETILLPTLIRQATGKSELEYQVAPGAANVGEERIEELLSETGRSVILLDGDDGGVENRDTLVEAGADSEKIKTYRDFSDEALVLEDLVDPEVYVEAVNAEISEWQDSDEQLVVEDISGVNCVESVEEWCEERDIDPPSKTGVSQRLVKIASDGRDIVNPNREEVLHHIDGWSTEHFVAIDARE